MIQIMASIKIEDFTRFISVFSTRGAALRRRHAGRNARLMRVAGATNEFLILYEWESKDSFEKYLADPAVQETMRSSGAAAPPKFVFLDNIADFPA